MSTQLVLGVAGAAVGFVVGGPAGAQMGWVAGTMIGGVVDPQNTEGPKLSDLKAQGSQYGGMIPIVHGSLRSAGNVIWSTDKRETGTEQGGKGGPTNTTFTYDVDCAIAICQGPIVGIRKIWANGRLIYSKASDATVETQAESESQADTYTVYIGSDVQLPDSTMEAALGVGNVPAYRGLAYVVVTGLQLADFGNQLPNFEFEIVAAGYEAAASSDDYKPLDNFSSEVCWGANSGLSDTPPFTEYPTFTSFDEMFTDAAATAAGAALEDKFPGIFSGPYYFERNPVWSSQQVYFFATEIASGISGVKIIYSVISSGYGFNDDPAVILAIDPTDEHYIGVAQDVPSPTCSVIGDPHETGVPVYFDGNSNYCIDAAGNVTVNQTYAAAIGTFRCLRFRAMNAGLPVAPVDPLGPVLPSTDPNYNNAAWWAAAAAAAGLSGTFGIDYGNVTTTVARSTTSVSSITSTPVLLSDIVTSICVNSGLTAGQIDVTQLTDSVHGYAITSQSTARDALAQLQTAYFFDAVESDGKIKFIKRGGAVATTIPFVELGASESGDAVDPISIQRVQEVDLPQRVTVSFLNSEADYQPGTESDSRLTTPSKQQVAVSLAIAMTSSQAKAIAVKTLYNAHLERSGFAIDVTRKYAKCEPTDIIDVTGESATYRLRIISKDESGPVIKLTAKQEDATVYTQNVIGSTQLPSQTQIEGPGLTHAEYLDIPIVRDEDDDTGLYVAMSGVKAAWTGAALYRSADDVSFLESGRVTNAAVLGWCDTALGDWTGGNVFDAGNSVTVTLDVGSLSSYTMDQVLSGSGYALVGSEIIQFTTATLIATLQYTLTGLLRGRRGTEQHQATHAAGERFVLLSLAGTLRINEGASAIDQLRYYRPTSFGKGYDVTASNQITNSAAGVTPLSPVNFGGGKQTNNDWIFTWNRRTRVDGTWRNRVDVALGESAEAYEIDIMSGTTVKRTISATSHTATYTSAMQTADFGGSQSTVTIKAYQISSVVGRGFPATKTY